MFTMIWMILMILLLYDYTRYNTTFTKPVVTEPEQQEISEE